MNGEGDGREGKGEKWEKTKDDEKYGRRMVRVYRGRHHPSFHIGGVVRCCKRGQERRDTKRETEMGKKGKWR